MRSSDLHPTAPHLAHPSHTGERALAAGPDATVAMYMAYGWPQSIPLDPGDSDGVVLLRVLNRLLLAVCPASLHLRSASHHKVRLARLDRSPNPSPPTAPTPTPSGA
ncbi:hypothetical protein QYE76_025884 [Lolium multiflorum]|uniref:Uncharacterized protein n=1 Tax=Lolium multiflorum TaxID=4521 RepID=A0AAD8RHN7_LOLMU|nr:hypothetical protein QYE76_025884 [Lolium multiflorum]